MGSLLSMHEKKKIRKIFMPVFINSEKHNLKENDKVFGQNYILFVCNVFFSETGQDMYRYSL